MTKIVKLKKHEERRILNGHLWAFSNEVQSVEGDPQSGDIVELHNCSGKFLGVGFFNPHSLISVRILSHNEEIIDFNFFKNRIEYAYKLRKRIYPDSETFRLVHGEGDYLSGLIIDKYEDYFVLQSYSAGMDQRLSLICKVLQSLFHPKSIIQRNESQLRTLEGLPLQKSILHGAIEPVTISEHGILYQVDLWKGQKTGFFLDQRENRKSIRRYVNNSRVLDCFCNDGGFALNAAQALATQVIGVDISESAIQRAIHNAHLNMLGDKIKFQSADAFEFLKNEVNLNKSYDVIILDPPSFTKSRRNMYMAKRGYKEIHKVAFQLISAGGILATASCSHHIREETFLSIINECALSIGRTIKLLEWNGAAPDHPVLPSMQETRYLKFGIFQVE